MTTADRHLRADARRNRDRLVAVAHEAFRQHGVSASLDEIARTAGVGIGTLYRHFPTRDDLIAALVATDLERIAVLADDLVGADGASGDDAGDALERWLNELVDHTVVYRGLAEAVVAAAETSAFGASCERVHTAGARLVQLGQRRGVVRDDVDGNDVIDLANSIAWVTQHATDPDLKRRLLRVSIDGLRATATITKGRRQRR